MRSFLDTNVLLRFLVGDIASQQKQAMRWFKEAETGQRIIVITPLIIAEACFVLESYYRQPREQIAAALQLFVAQIWLEVVERDALLGLWRWYRNGLHFVDSFLLALTQISGGEILSFDKELIGQTAKN